MSYKLQTDEKLPEGVRRVALEQIDQALEYLHSPEGNLEEVVHESRKHFKKLRGLLRLVRKEIGSSVYQRENICFRDAGRLLSDLRDSAVAIETLDGLIEDFDKVLDKDAFTTMRETLIIFYYGTRQHVIEEEQALQKVTAKIEAARQRVTDWPVEDYSFSAVSGGLHKVYKRGRNRMQDAADSPTTAALHEWRKRVKYLWYSVRLLQPIWPEPMAVFADEIHDLSDYLGDDHDLAELHKLMEKRPSILEGEDARHAFASLIEHKRSELQTQAMQQGQLIYAEPPDDFVARMQTYWTAVHS